MRLPVSLLAFCLSLSAAFGCSSTVDTNTGGAGGGGSGGGGSGGSGGSGGAGGGVACVVPTDTVPLGVPQDPSGMNPIHEADGAFAATADGFTVTTAAETIYISGVSPAVPDGTFVHITHAALQGFYGPAGAVVRLDNLPELDGAPNPTEDGTRVWYFAASEGGNPGDESPFTATYESYCSTGDFENGSNDVETLTLTWTDGTITVLPGQEESFTVASGEDAGAYVAKNVNIQYIGAPGGDAWSITNFTIARGE